MIVISIEVHVMVSIPILASPPPFLDLSTVETLATPVHVNMTQLDGNDYMR